MYVHRCATCTCTHSFIHQGLMLGPMYQLINKMLLNWINFLLTLKFAICTVCNLLNMYLCAWCMYLQKICIKIAICTTPQPYHTESERKTKFGTLVEINVLTLDSKHISWKSAPLHLIDSFYENKNHKYQRTAEAHVHMSTIQKWPWNWDNYNI